MRPFLGPLVLAVVVAVAVAATVAMSDIVSLASPRTLGDVKALPAPPFTPIVDVVSTHDFGTLFVVENVHEDYDQQVGLLFYLLRTDVVASEFTQATFNASVWKYTAPNTLSFTGTSRYFAPTTVANGILLPRVDLSSTAYNQTYAVKVSFEYLTSNPSPTPIKFFLEVLQAG